jgi:pyridoxamine 5'-phosphate oxidase
VKRSTLAKLNRDYPGEALVEGKTPRDPFRLFHHWFRLALQARILDPHAMALSTTGSSGKPSSRMVLLKGLDREGFVFFTNYLSRKGRDLARRPGASLLFFWAKLGLQIRVEGKARRVSARESEEYFMTRPRGSQLSAWASRQSEVVAGRKVLESRMRELEKFYQGKAVPRPPHWGGFRLIPSSIEFWSGRRNRLHDRLLYQRKGKTWTRVRLAP